MCGIIAVLRRASSRKPPSPDEAIAEFKKLDSLLSQPTEAVLEGIAEVASQAASLNQMLSGAPGFVSMAQNLSDIQELTDEITQKFASFEQWLESSQSNSPVSKQNSDLATSLKDNIWAIQHDRVETATKASEFLGLCDDTAETPIFSPQLYGAALSIQTVLSALDRLEVRGRDSAGICVIAPAVPTDLVTAELLARSDDELFKNRSIRSSSKGETASVCFTYKVAAEIGELGDNTRELRQSILADESLRQCLAANLEEAVVLGHTRWASIGIISEANAHPLESATSPGFIAAINGDIDNYQSLIEDFNLSYPKGISTDSKAVPLLVEHFLKDADQIDQTVSDAFAKTSDQLEGSAAIVGLSLEDPSKLHLSVHGSGQALYAGLAEDSFVVASEPYGLLEQTSRYVRFSANGHSNTVRLNADLAGELAGIENIANPDVATQEAITPEVVTAEITTRDVARGDFEHYLLKEISESPISVKNTLRLGESLNLQGLKLAGIKKVVAIGQGTAAVAAQAFVTACQDEFQDVRNIPEVRAMVASELSGFAMNHDMSDHLIVAISQSGTTTDTNRTVDLAKSRGAKVIAIVNRRNSDLTDKSDAVIYTSDGRDVEMSVASTKAFYAQVVAGFFLAFQLCDTLLSDTPLSQASPHQSARRQRLLDALQKLPEALAGVLELRGEIAQIAQEVATSHRDWAVVGSGRDRIAAEEVRIKLSELCYKSVSCDAIEDKKHIDLSSEPLILVCAAGIGGSNAEDILKEVAIYLAHKATPVVFLSNRMSQTSLKIPEAQKYPEVQQKSVPEETNSSPLNPPASPATQETSGSHILEIPVAAPELAFVSSAMAGHLFAYEAALAVDALADPLRATRAALETTIANIESEPASPSDTPSSPDAPPDTHSTAPEAPPTTPEAVEKHWLSLQEPVRLQGQTFAQELSAGHYDGHLSAGLASKLSSLYKYTGGVTGIGSYAQEFGVVGTPAVILADFLSALNLAIDALSRPVDAIRHQAKTVTVGITRSDEELLSRPLAAAVAGAGAPRDSLSYETLRELASLDPIVAEVTGHIRYEINGEKLEIVNRAGASLEIPSIVEGDPELRGTKYHVAAERRVFLTRGRRDKRTILIVPEIIGSETNALTLLHLELQDFLSADVATKALKGYRGRYEALWGAVTETEKHFDSEVLSEVPVDDLFIEPIVTLADRWRRG